MGGCSSETLSLLVRFVMFAAAESVDRGREELQEAELPAWPWVESEGRSHACDGRMAGTPGEKRLTCGGGRAEAEEGPEVAARPAAGLLTGPAAVAASLPGGLRVHGRSPISSEAG